MGRIAKIHELPRFSFPTIDDVKKLEVKGPWTTKSEANLDLIFQMPLDDARKFLNYNSGISKKFMGLRAYSVRGINPGINGGGEFHKIRKEILFGLEGSVSMTIEDLRGETKHFSIDSRHGIYLPNFLLHTYRAEEDNSGLIVIANTLYDDKNPTRDVYSREKFEELKRKFSHNN